MTSAVSALILDAELRHQGSTESDFAKMWASLRIEVHCLLCTNDARYAEARMLLKTSAAPVVGLLASTLVSRFGVSAGTAGTMAAIAMIVPLRVSINAWCRAFPSNANGLVGNERATLKELSQK